jgi:hypothetical protein
MLRTRDVRRRLWGLLGIISLWMVFGDFGMAHAESTPTPPNGLYALKQPVAMPSFNLPTTHGGTLDSATLAGRVVIVRFWASW